MGKKPAEDGEVQLGLGTDPVAAAELPESLGRRIARFRQKLGYTQQDLADRLAISRVAVSHLEAGLSEPGERTIALLAGVFKVHPHDLVEDTAYPRAKTERLPLVVAWHTEVELQLALLDNDLLWLSHLSTADAVELLTTWKAKLSLLRDDTHDRRERDAIDEAVALVNRTLDTLL